LSVGIPGIAGVTFSDTDEFGQWITILGVTAELRDAGVLTDEEYKEKALRAPDKLEREAEAPPRRSGRRLFGLF